MKRLIKHSGTSSGREKGVKKHRKIAVAREDDVPIRKSQVFRVQQEFVCSIPSGNIHNEFQVRAGEDLRHVPGLKIRRGLSGSSFGKGFSGDHVKAVSAEYGFQDGKLFKPFRGQGVGKAGQGNGC